MDLDKKLNDMGSAFDAFKKANDLKLEEIKKNGEASAATLEKVDKASTHMDTLDKQIEEIKAAINRAPQGNADPKQAESKLQAEYGKAMDRFLSKGVDLPQEMIEYAQKAMSSDSNEDGGFFVSPQVSTEISKLVFESSPIRQLASVQMISSNQLDIMYDGDEVASGWVSETATRAETGTPVIKMISIPVHELYANPKASQRLLDDASVNVEAWLKGKVTEKFSRDEATAFVSGNGAAKPKGILAYAEGTAFDQIERVDTAANNAYDGNDFIGIQASLKEPYQNNASWLMNRLIVSEVRQLKDTTSGQYIWQPGLTAGQPNQLLGRPVYFATDLPSAIAPTTDMVIYGDIKQGYQVVDRIGIRVLRDPFTAKPHVSFYTTKRVGGGVKRFEAMKVLKQLT